MGSEFNRNLHNIIDEILLNTYRRGNIVRPALLCLMNTWMKTRIFEQQRMVQTIAQCLEHSNVKPIPREDNVNVKPVIETGALWPDEPDTPPGIPKQEEKELDIWQLQAPLKRVECSP